MDMEIGLQVIKWIKWQGERILSSYMSEPKQFCLHILHCKSFMYRLYILMKSLDKWNTTSEADIIVYCFNYNQYSCLVCPSPKFYQYATWEMSSLLIIFKV